MALIDRGPFDALIDEVPGVVEGTVWNKAQIQTVLLDPIDAAITEISPLVVRELPTGAIDGSNATFTLAYTPVVGSEQVFLNGLLQESGGEDYSISGRVLTFVAPLLSGDRIRVTYQRT